MCLETFILQKYKMLTVQLNIIIILLFYCNLSFKKHELSLVNIIKFKILPEHDLESF